MRIGRHSLVLAAGPSVQLPLRFSFSSATTARRIEGRRQERQRNTLAPHSRTLSRLDGTPRWKNNGREELELLSARTLLSKCRAGCAAANILPPRAGPPNLGLLRSPATDHGPQQLIGSSDGNSALALS